MSYRTMAGTSLLVFLSLNFTLVLLGNLGVDFPRQLWWVWVFVIIATAELSWLAVRTPRSGDLK
jgi:hypothetical protein